MYSPMNQLSQSYLNRHSGRAVYGRASMDQRAREQLLPKPHAVAGFAIGLKKELSFFIVAASLAS